jgi:hypothetical protein
VHSHSKVKLNLSMVIENGKNLLKMDYLIIVNYSQEQIMIFLICKKSKITKLIHKLYKNDYLIKSNYFYLFIILLHY